MLRLALGCCPMRWTELGLAKYMAWLAISLEKHMSGSHAYPSNTVLHRTCDVCCSASSFAAGRFVLMLIHQYVVLDNSPNAPCHVKVLGVAVCSNK